MTPEQYERRLSWLRTFRGYTEDEAELAAWAADEIDRLRETLEAISTRTYCDFGHNPCVGGTRRYTRGYDLDVAEFIAERGHHFAPLRVSDGQAEVARGDPEGAEDTT